MMHSSFIEEVPKSSQPRERLATYGARALSDEELLAIVLRTGTRSTHVLDLARRFLRHFDNLHNLSQASLENFQEVAGIGPVKSIELKAAIELGRRIHKCTLPRYGRLSSTGMAGEWLMEHMRHLHQEHLMVLFLNSKNEIIRKKTIFIGTVNQSVAHPREIFKEAVKYPTARMILGHNHPSGDPEPSSADIQFTERMILCGGMMGIEILDHIVVGESSYVSIREDYNIFD